MSVTSSLFFVISVVFTALFDMASTVKFPFSLTAQFFNNGLLDKRKHTTLLASVLAFASF